MSPNRENHRHHQRTPGSLTKSVNKNAKFARKKDYEIYKYVTTKQHVTKQKESKTKSENTRVADEVCRQSCRVRQKERLKKDQKASRLEESRQYTCFFPRYKKRQSLIVITVIHKLIVFFKISICTQASPQL